MIIVDEAVQEYLEIILEVDAGILTNIVLLL